MQPIWSRFTLLAVFCGCGLIGVAHSAETPLSIGDQVPEFQCSDDQGKVWASRDHVGKKLIVLYFYPSDFSFCCTRQAVGYRDRLQELRDQGAEVVGISGDAVDAHRWFQRTHKLKFRLLSDFDGEIARKFGLEPRLGGKATVTDEDGHEVLDAQGKSIKIARQVTVVRGTFVIDTLGRVIYQNTNVSPFKDSQAVLEFLRQHNTK